MAGNINEARVALNSMRLLIEIIGDYRKAAAVTKITRNAKQRATEYRARNLLLVLKTEHARFVNTLAHVLKYRIADVIKDMVDWDNPNMRATLKSTFGSSLGSFFSALRQLVECVREVEKILKIDDYDKAPWSPRNPRDSIRRPWSDAVNDPEVGFSIVAFKFRYCEFLMAINDGKLDVQLASIERLNERIEVLVWRSIRPSGKKLEISQLKILERIRSYSSTISRALGAKSGFQCGCRGAHTVVLKLEDMIEQSAKIEKSEPMLDELKFSMVLNNPACKSRYSDWKWAEMDVKVLNPGKSHGISTDETSDSDLSDVPPALDQSVKRKIVGFAKTGLWFKGKSPMADLTTSLDLCQKISGMHSKTLNSVSVLGNKQTGILELCVQPLATSYEAWSSLISFHGLLSASDDLVPRPAEFSTEHKLRLALKASASVLHLYQTPWLKQRWTSNDILLIQSEDGKTLADAFVTHNLHQAAHDSTSSNDTFSNVFEPTIFALGVFLIELSMNRPWERIRRGAVRKITKLDNEEDGSFIADLAAIDAIIQQATDEKVPPRLRPFYKEGPFYLEAVRACLLCELDGKASLQDTDFRQAVFEKVIRPLHLALEDCQYTTSGGILSLDSLPSVPSKEIQNNFSLFDDKDARPEAPARADEWFDLFRDEVAPLLPKPRTKKTDRVKVALFDTGLDPTDAVIRRQLGRITYKSFIPGEESHTAKDAKDENGHGTHCAALLLKVAKNSEVYIGRVTMGKKLESPEYISQAIEWAISEGVNLISMSFGFPRYTQALTDIQSSILSAYQSGIIIFAAASNGGGNSGLAYPANQNEVICIGASDGKGNKSDFTPGPYPDISNYTTLGEGVTSSWPKALSQTGQERTKIMSGTSVATPIAVGIAAMVVDFLRQLPRDVDQNLEFLVERQLRSKKGMNAVLKRLTEERDGFMYIAPWILFCDDRKEGVAQVLLDALRSC